ncbi:hypothetical protein [Pontibacter anaerobius]|uniref:Uncharacterized protein n=1 Tax=Pontibacter anaerobius TaxID=2993940 RepID=A0ABT3RKC9_9BACT|nr:hypothetical protein [Pontibacter anaerobius]MCX2741906.1 hypothetical protein [Pontibacter anaerobius]
MKGLGWQNFPPPLTFCKILYSKVPLLQEFGHVAFQEKKICAISQQAQGGDVRESVMHDGSLLVLLKKVLMSEIFKSAFHHLISKKVWAIIGCDFTRQCLPQTEVPCPPGYLHTKAYKPACNSGYCRLSSMSGGDRMQIDAPAQVKAAMDGCSNGGGEKNLRHNAKLRKMQNLCNLIEEEGQSMF